MSERAAPFYCPYCGEEDLRPSERETARGAGAAWECTSCGRDFALTFLGVRAVAPPSGHRTEGGTTA
ncbi:hypothetical protein LHJ74_13450 [Streptomyces sp. N2-109]|uniref:Insertion element protein n=1 Tax=Streptomyces gossypii TaxID=2883101 RepID=A0ABT2JUD9_9ACTN|nr:hypothetical protein [Streptomyces gossypii]MCT2590904.1 hypothetical protein [Streptomyces gossypii]